MRVGYGEPQNLMQLVDGLDADGLANVEIGNYGPTDFFDDVAQLAEFRTDAEIMGVVANRSFDTLVWMRTQGV